MYKYDVTSYITSRIQNISQKIFFFFNFILRNDLNAEFENEEPNYRKKFELIFLISNSAIFNSIKNSLIRIRIIPIERFCALIRRRFYSKRPKKFRELVG